jgi:transposase InsO family protein
VDIVVDRAIGGVQVTRILDRLAMSRGFPKVIGTDNGKEFCGRAMLSWVHANGVQLNLSEPGKFNQNAYVESFNGRLRDECLNEHWFMSLAHARTLIEAWRPEYNEERSKKALGGHASSACRATGRKVEPSGRRTLNGTAIQHGVTWGRSRLGADSPARITVKRLKGPAARPFDAFR